MAEEATTLRSEVLKSLQFPIVLADILRKRQAIKRELLKQTNLVPTRIAILGGSTTTEVKSMLELFLWHKELSQRSTNQDTTATLRMLSSKTQICGISSPISFLFTLPGTTYPGFRSCWKQRMRWNTAFVMKWPALSRSGKIFTPSLVRSSSRTTLTCQV